LLCFVDTVRRTRKAVTLKDVGVETPGIEQGRGGIVDRIFKKNHA
jgi:hypothetical protein